MEGISFFAVDIFICVIVLLSFIIGWARGATKEILSVVAWIGGGYLAVSSFPYAKEFTRTYISHKLIADFVTACGLFILFLTLLSVFNYFCSNLVKRSMLNTTDKALGGIFGIARGAVILAALDLIINQCMLNETPKFVENSKLRGVVTSISNFMILVLPEDLQAKILEHMSQVKKQTLMNFIKDRVVDKIISDGSQSVLEAGSSNNIEAENAKKNSDIKEEDEFIEEESVPLNDGTQSAEELATLRPKKIVVNKKDKDLSKKSRNDMDRLLAQYDDTSEN